jgi:hypothetical protein
VLADRGGDDDDDIASGNLTASSLRTATMAAEEAINAMARVPATLKPPYVYTTDHDTDACVRSLANTFLVFRKFQGTLLPWPSVSTWAFYLQRR